MKTVLIAIFLVLITSNSTLAQKIFVSVGIEKTVFQNQVTADFSFETKRGIGMGVFYQMGVSLPGSTNELTSQQSIYGGIVQLPLAKSNKLALYGNLRIGFVDKNYLVAIPSIETRVTLGKRTGVSFGSSFRQGYPAFSLKTFIKLF